jgi:hypothetical protein
MVENFDFIDCTLPPADKMATPVNDSMNYHLDTARGRTSFHTLYSSLTAARIDVSKHKAEAALTADGPDGLALSLL